MEMCRKMRNQPRREKLKFLMSNGSCFACLVTGHRSNDCTNRLKCTICRGSHPTVLHYKKDDTQDNRLEESDAPDTSKTCMSTGAGDYDSTVAIIPVRVKLINSDKYIETYAFLDEGSDATFCTTKLMDQLNARGRRTKVRLRTMEKTRVIDTYVIRELEACYFSGTNTVKLPMVYTREEMPVSMKDVPRQADVDRWSYLRGIHIPDIDSEVELLIGTNAPKAS